MKVYRRLETPKLYANVYEESISDDGVLSRGDLYTTALSSMQIIIEDKTGDVVQALADMDAGTGDDAGKYTYSGYTIPATANTGTWNYECRANASSKVASGFGSFEVKEQVA